MTPKPAATKQRPQDRTGPPTAENVESSGAPPEPSPARSADNPLPMEEPSRDREELEEHRPEGPKKADEPAQHCPVCGVEMVVQGGYWVCADEKCGTRLPHEFHQAEELAR